MQCQTTSNHEMQKKCSHNFCSQCVWYKEAEDSWCSWYFCRDFSMTSNVILDLELLCGQVDISQWVKGIPFFSPIDHLDIRVLPD